MIPLAIIVIRVPIYYIVLLNLLIKILVKCHSGQQAGMTSGVSGLSQNAGKIPVVSNRVTLSKFSLTDFKKIPGVRFVFSYATTPSTTTSFSERTYLGSLYL